MSTIKDFGKHATVFDEFNAGLIKLRGTLDNSFAVHLDNIAIMNATTQFRNAAIMPQIADFSSSTISEISNMRFPTTFDPSGLLSEYLNSDSYLKIRQIQQQAQSITKPLDDIRSCLNAITERRSIFESINDTYAKHTYIQASKDFINEAIETMPDSEDKARLSESTSKILESVESKKYLNLSNVLTIMSIMLAIISLIINQISSNQSIKAIIQAINANAAVVAQTINENSEEDEAQTQRLDDIEARLDRLENK